MFSLLSLCLASVLDGYFGLCRIWVQFSCGSCLFSVSGPAYQVICRFDISDTNFKFDAVFTFNCGASVLGYMLPNIVDVMEI